MFDFNFLYPIITCIIECVTTIAESSDFIESNTSTAIDSTSSIRVLGTGINGDIIYDTSDPLPDHNLLFEDLGISENDDHLTYGGV